MSCRLAVIDDNTDVRELLAAALRDRGCRILAAFDGAEGACEWGGWGSVEAAVVDWHLADGIDARDLLRWLADEHPDVVRVIYTAMPLSMLDAEAHLLADHVIDKGSPISVLADAVHVAGHDRNREHHDA